VKEHHQGADQYHAGKCDAGAASELLELSNSDQYDLTSRLYQSEGEHRTDGEAHDRRDDLVVVHDNGKHFFAEQRDGNDTRKHW